MKIVLNTRSERMGARVCIYDLYNRLRCLGVDTQLNDWDHYDRYDVAVFMGYDEEVDKAKAQNPDILVAIADPKESTPEYVRATKKADFLMVSSVEQRDALYKYNRNILIYYMFPEMEQAEKKHINHSPIVIGYHGNRDHLECMANGVQLALNELAKRRKIEFWAMYNVDRLGRAHIGMPDDSLMRIRHIQWSEENYFNELGKVDIGIVPNEIPIKDKKKVLDISAYPIKEFRYEPYDHITRYKASSNPGRIYVFSKLGIPVVSDFFPSAAQFILDGHSGFLASSPQSWFEALNQLADSEQLRQVYAANLQTVCDEIGNPRLQTEQFLQFCQNDAQKKPITFTSQNLMVKSTKIKILEFMSRGKRKLKKIKEIFRHGLG